MKEKEMRVCKMSLQDKKQIICHLLVWDYVYIRHRGVSFSSLRILEIESKYSSISIQIFGLFPKAFERYFLPISISLSLTGRKLLKEWINSEEQVQSRL